MITFVSDSFRKKIAEAGIKDVDVIKVEKTTCTELNPIILKEPAKN